MFAAVTVSKASITLHQNVLFFTVSFWTKTGLSTGDGKCRDCRLLSIFGQGPHVHLEFGRAHCVLTPCLHLLMRAWDREHIRKDMLDPHFGISWGASGAPTERKEFALWLTEEFWSKEAGICDGIRWLSRHLPADVGEYVLMARTSIASMDSW